MNQQAAGAYVAYDGDSERQRKGVPMSPIVPFFTSGSSGFGSTLATLQSCCTPETRWRDGTRLSPSATPAQISRWLSGLDL